MIKSLHVGDAAIHKSDSIALAPMGKVLTYLNTGKSKTYCFYIVFGWMNR